MNRIAYTPTSTVMLELLDEAPADHFTLGWLMGSLHKRSFGIIMLLLALVAIAPGVSMVVGLPLAIIALQMIAGRVQWFGGPGIGFPPAKPAEADQITERPTDRIQHD